MSSGCLVVSAEGGDVAMHVYNSVQIRLDLVRRGWRLWYERLSGRFKPPPRRRRSCCCAGGDKTITLPLTRVDVGTAQEPVFGFLDP